MTDSHDDLADDEAFGRLLLTPLVEGWRFIVAGALFLTVLAGTAVGLWYAFKSEQLTAFMEFSVVFPGAEGGRYPNNTPFSVKDINQRTLVDRVFDVNHIEPFCGRDDFRSAFSLSKGSPQLRFLDADYGTRLADARITAADRQRLQEEYLAKREALQGQYLLTFVRPAWCSSLPPLLVFKSLNDLLQSWAEESETKRDALNAQISLISPSVFARSSGGGKSLLTDTDLIRSALERAWVQANQIRSLPGATLVRVGESRVAIDDVLQRLHALIYSRLDPLVSAGDIDFARADATWLDEQLKSALAEVKEVEGQRLGYLTGLREYFGNGSAVPATRSEARGPVADDVRTQVDAEFLDRVVALSTDNVRYRQKLTDGLLRSSLALAEAEAKAERYRQLKASLATGGRSSLTAAELSRRLDRIVADGRQAVTQMAAIYDEYLRVSWRAPAMMYRIEQPAQADSEAGFSLQRWLLVVAGVFVLSVLFLGAVCIAGFYLRPRPPAA